MNPGLAAVLAEIDTVDWSAYTDRPTSCDTGRELRRLAEARLLNQAASAAT